MAAEIDRRLHRQSGSQPAGSTEPILTDESEQLSTRPQRNSAGGTVTMGMIGESDVRAIRHSGCSAITSLSTRPTVERMRSQCEGIRTRTQGVPIRRSYTRPARRRRKRTGISHYSSSESDVDLGRTAKAKTAAGLGRRHADRTTTDASPQIHRGRRDDSIRRSWRKDDSGRDEQQSGQHLSLRQRRPEDDGDPSDDLSRFDGRADASKRHPESSPPRDAEDRKGGERKTPEPVDQIERIQRVYVHRDILPAIPDMCGILLLDEREQGRILAVPTDR